MKGFHVVIPARFGSRRLPGKALALLGGVPMVQRVVECAQESAARSVTVATDDVRIQQAVEKCGGAVVMTGREHQSGTDRVAEAVGVLGLGDDEVVVNLQGDEPTMPGALLEQVARAVTEGVDVATAATAVEGPEEVVDEGVVKVVTDRQGRALYFSRAAIPWGGEGVRRHIGVYGYRCEYVRRFSGRGECWLERQERLEQLRALWYGDVVAVVEAVAVPGIGVDTAEDLRRVRERWGG